MYYREEIMLKYHLFQTLFLHTIGKMIKIENFLYKEGEIFFFCHVTYKLVVKLENKLSSKANLLKISYLICRMKLLHLVRHTYLCCNAAIPTLHAIKRL